MNKLLNRIKLAKALLKLASVMTDNGELTWEGELVEGVEVFVEVEGEMQPAADGEYLTDEQKIVVEGGKVVSVEAVEVEEPVEEPVEEVVVEAEDEEPVAEPEPENNEVEELKKQLEEKDAKIAELEAMIAELENKNKEQEEALKMSADEPAKHKVTKSAARTFKSYL